MDSPYVQQNKSRDIWVSSDFHFNHTNILKFGDSSGKLFRGDRFSFVEDMNEHMIEQHNKHVKKATYLYVR